MHKPRLQTVALLLSGLLLAFIAAPALSQPRPQARAATMNQRIAAKAGLKEADVEAVLQALAPEVRAELAAGNTVNFPGLGTFRVVEVAAHKDLVGGRPATIEAYNYVDFVPSRDLDGAANNPNARPAATVIPFEYNPLPTQTPGLRAPNTRMPNVRTR